MKSSTANGTVTAPPSKSYTHRAMVLGALTGSNFSLKKPLMSEDTKATLESLQRMGAEVDIYPSYLRLRLEELTAPAEPINARNSGTTIRLLTALASLLPATTTLTGDASLTKRPMGPLMDALTQLGASCVYIGQSGRPPLRIKGPISKTHAEVKGDVSSQFISSLLIACTQKKEDTKLNITGQITSRPYVDITLDMLDRFGAKVEESPSGFEIPGRQILERESYAIPGDFSSAAFLFAAAAITGGRVAVRQLDSKSPQGDKAIIGLLERFGASVSRQPHATTVSGGALRGMEVNVRAIPDLFPILAVVGAVSDGKTVLKGGENLRVKESDRIATTVRFLQDMGARILPKDDGCEIIGVPRLNGAKVDTQGDHRILMAATIAALVSTTDTVIEDDESYRISYPGFIRDLHQLGCRVEVRK
ncbi:MAG: 3-phosphoshikimate 1-carboxyvinyltransferase [Methanobacteriota archaeon]|nr:MAG: 3-phosphoshikimate 1-carboxyvinyltransferase [Euryarchaeota archaeon]